MPKGNPNPSPDTRFGGKRGNKAAPGGKSKGQRKMELEAAEMAVKLRHIMLSTLVDQAETGAGVEDLIEPSVLKLLKDSEDRSGGTPVQAIQHGNDPDNPLIKDPNEYSDEQLAAIAVGSGAGASEET